MIKTRIYPRGQEALSFPKIPDELGHRAVFTSDIVFDMNNEQNVYVLFASNDPFVEDDQDITYLYTGSSFKIYQCVPDMAEWVEISTNNLQKNIYYGYKNTTYIWSNTDVFYYDSTDKTVDLNETIHTGMEYEDIEGADKPFLLAAPSGTYQLYTGDDSLKLVCLCITTDDGELSYELRKVKDTKDDEGKIIYVDDGRLLEGNTFLVETKEAQEEGLYRFLITNNLNDTKTTIYTEIFTIQILEGLPIDKKIMMFGWMTARKTRQFAWTAGTGGLPTSIPLADKDELIFYTIDDERVEVLV